jgi:hypothetical protein
VAVLYTLKLRGDPREILEKVSSVSDEVWEIVTGHGFVGETVGRTDDGVVIAEVWETHEGFQAGMSHPEVAAEFQRLAMPAPEVSGPFPVIRDYQPGRQGSPEVAV